MKKQCDILYKIEGNLKNNIPIDFEEYKQLKDDDLIYKLYLDLSTRFQTEDIRVIEEMFRRALIQHSDMMPQNPNEGMKISIILYLLFFNQYINTDMKKLDVKSYEMFLVEGSGHITVNVIYAANDFYDKIVAPLPSEEEVRNRLEQLNSGKYLRLNEINATDIIYRLKLFKKACPVGYHMLTTAFYKFYDIGSIEKSGWSFFDDYYGYGVLINGNFEIDYYNFCKNTLNAMKTIMKILNVLDENHNIIYKNVNYTIGRLMDADNPYNNIFNKKQYYMNIGEVNPNDISRELIIKDIDQAGNWDKDKIIAEIKQDLKKLKKNNEEFYNSIMKNTFDNVNSFDDWLKNHQGLEYPALREKYLNMFNLLGKEQIIAEMRQDLIYLKNINEDFYNSIMEDIFDNANSFDDWLKNHQGLEYSTLREKYLNMFNLLGKEQIIAEMKHDLIYLKNINANLYKSIMKNIFDKANSFDDWIKNQEKLEYSTLYEKYLNIFNQLNEYRTVQEVLDNEINVIINQLDDYTIYNLDIQKGLKNMKSKIYGQLAYTIDFWNTYIENHELNINNQRISYLVKLYNEIMGYAIYHVFDDKIDLNALNINQMKDLFLNNLYRAYHCPDRYSGVFDILKKKNIQFNNFKEYENYINSIQDKNTNPIIQ